MAGGLRVFGLLLRKNLIVRMRHWKLTVFLEALVPIFLFVLIQAVRDYSVRPPRIINESTYFLPQLKNDLINQINYEHFFLLYMPKNGDTDQIMESTRQCLKLPIDKVQSFSMEKEMLGNYTELDAKHPFANVLAVIFEKYNTSSIQYKIRHSAEISTNLYENIFAQTFGTFYRHYYSTVPFIQTQMCIDESFINRIQPGALANTEVSIERVPYPPYIKIDETDLILRQVLCVFAVIAFLIPLCVEANYAAQEKFIGVNVLMLMNGVKLHQNLLSWLVTGVIFSSFYVLPIIVLFKVTFTGHVDPYLHYGNAFLFWIVITTLVVHLIAFGMHIAAYFSKPRFVVIALSIIYSAALSLHGNLIKEESFGALPFLGILFPNVLIYRFFEEVNTYESKLTGVHWSNLFFVGDQHYSVAGSTGCIFLFSLAGALIHFALSVYINNIHPGKYGVPKNPLYFLNMCMKRNKVCLEQEAGELNYSTADNTDFEPIERGVFTPGIQIRGVKKNYRTSWLGDSMVQALKGISMDLYKGQITALLGHNGAGKTTLMSILTGVTSTTEGNVYINGSNVCTDLELIRKDLGLCPQENMYFPDLNVLEQMEFFGQLKGPHKSRKNILSKARELLSKLKLSEKENVLPSKLSGGQKRRLCLGMALIGEASTVIMDEPTSGMDPETRRDTWDIILKMRGEKTIMISTHNMEEADILGDRIAILHGGRLRSYGTGMFLKKQHGHGCVEVTLSTKPWCSPEKVRSIFDSNTETVSADSERIVLSVPQSTALPKALDAVENTKKGLGVTGISVSLITLEQVFLNIVKKEENGKTLTEFYGDAPEKITGFHWYTQAIWALYQKKFTYTRKNLATLLTIIGLPLLSIVLMGLNNGPASVSMALFPLEMDIYRSPRAFYTASDPKMGEYYKKSVEYVNGIARDVSNFQSLTNALLEDAINDVAHYRNTLIAAAEFNASGSSTNARAFYSGTATHSIPISINLLSNTLLKSVAGEQYSIRVSRQQLPESLSQTKLSMPTEESMSRVIIFCTFFFPTMALFVIHPVQERLTLVKQLQRMTGVNSLTYWLTMFTSDFLAFMVAVCVIDLGFYTMDRILAVELYRGTEILTMTLLLMLFGINSLLLAYILSFSNKSRNSILTFLSIAPLGLVIMQYLIHQLSYSMPNLKTFHEVQKRVLELLPHVTLFHGQMSFFEIAVQNARCRRLPNRLLAVVCTRGDPCCLMDCWDGNCKKPIPYFGDFSKDISLEECLTYLGLTPLLYLLILLLLEERCCSRLIAKLRGMRLRNPCGQMDEQVKKEKEAVATEINRINSDGSNSGIMEISRTSIVSQSDLVHSSETDVTSLFLVYELSKYYGKVMAVREISFQVKQKECFGLLGVNGAGKSTTFRMLTGEEMPDSGHMYLKQWHIRSDRKQYLAEMAYCPQTDALLESLNTFDHLRLFGLLRGVPKSKIDLEVNRWINRLNLTACMKQPSGTYSGGNKRRLNIAMALIGNPTLVLLDEPTTGVDPAARRSLWTVLQSCQATGQAIILTSHSMEECEALCNRLVIMVKGQLVCLGASQELKQRFGAGYDIQIKLNPNRTDEDVEKLKQKVEASLTCEITDENLGYLAYHVTYSGTTWQKMYDTLENLKSRYPFVEDYAVLSATLERLFLQFARGAEVATNAPTDDPQNSTSQPVNV